LQFDPNGQPCNYGNCFAGYSCVGDRCVADGSQLRGEECAANLQCGDGLRCHPEKLVCTSVCKAHNSFFGLEAKSCESGEYCGPGENHESGNFESFCTKQDPCDACDSTQLCLALAAGVTACERACNIRFANDGHNNAVVYQDDCNTRADVETCQLIGRNQPICTPSRSRAPQQEGESCAAYNNPCAPGLTCVVEGNNNVCRAFCNPQNTVCPGTQSCCRAVPQAFGVCRPECPTDAALTPLTR
jgi:hypothetical protein